MPFEPFNSVTSRIAAAKSAQVRREQGALVIALEKAIAERPPDDPTARVKRVAKQMDAVEKLMEKSKDSKELANLSAAHARLFSAWCVLTGTKSPGTLGKSRRERPTPPQPIPAPLDNTMSNPPANEDWKQFTG